jgi:hypothetical protein
MPISLFAAGLAAETFDSAALAGTAMVSHSIRQTGEWGASLVVGRSPLPVRTILVLPAAGAALVPLEPDCAVEQRLRIGGHIRLRAPNGGGLSARLSLGDASEPDWSSQVLGDGDWFACLPLRPGRYRLVNLLSQAAADVVVRYPDPRVQREALARTVPVRLRAGENIEPAQIELFPGQPVIVEIGAPSHLRLALVDPDDGPADLAQWREESDGIALATLQRRSQAS